MAKLKPFNKDGSPNFRGMLKEIKQFEKLAKKDSRFSKYFHKTMKDCDDLLTDIIKTSKKIIKRKKKTKGRKNVH